ncbi:MAG: hypothetical protein KY469_10805 [Actinobacteria bacterium]|nr:hypothetical protein [Actinomycetota bacterium]
MPTADVTLRPNSTVSLGSTWSVQGTTAHAAASDDNNATYLQTSAPHSTSKAVVGVADVASPAGSKIEAVRVRGIVGVAGGTPGTTTKFSLGLLGPIVGGAVTYDVGQSFTHDADGPMVSWTSQWWTSNPQAEFTDASLDGAQVTVLHFTGSGAPSLRVAELYVDVDWNERPTVALTGPATPVTDTSRPLVTWTYADPEGDAQSGFEVRIYLEADMPGTGWPADPDDGTITADPVYTSGDVSSSNPQHQVDTLDNDTAYRVYVRARQVWSGDGTHWSGWVHATFTLDLAAPPPPTLTVTPDPDTANVVLDVSSAAPVVGEIEPEWYQVQADWGDGTWVEVRGATIDGRELEPDMSRDATVVDRETPFNTVVSYRARGVADVTGEIVAGPWSTTKIATLANELRWLTDPLDPSVGGSVWADRVERGFVPGRQHVHIPAAGGDVTVVLAVVESEPVVQRIVVEGLTFDDDSYATMETLLRSRRTLLYRDRRLRAYVRWEAGRDLAPRFHDAARIDGWRGALVEVARPSP